MINIKAVFFRSFFCNTHDIFGISRLHYTYLINCLKLRATYFYLIVACLMSNTYQVLGQNFSHIKHYTTDDGLPHNVGYNLMQDSKGFLWVCTDDGLARFDGNKFKVFRSKDGLLSNYPIDVTEDKQGTIWVGTWKGGVNYIKNDAVYTPKIESPLFRVFSIDISRDKMLLSDGKTSIRIYQRTGKQWTYATSKRQNFLYAKQDSLFLHASSYGNPYTSPPYQALDDIRSYLATDQSILFFASRPGVWKYQNDSTFTPFFPDIVKKDTIYHISQDSSQRYWLGSYGKIIIIGPHGDSKVLSQNIPRNDIYDIEHGIDGKIYFLTGPKNLNHRGIYSYDPINKQLEDLKKKYNFKAQPSNLTIDKEGNVWIATNGDGLHCMTYNRFVNYAQQQGLKSSFIKNIAQDKHGNIYVGTINGLYKFHPGNYFTRIKLAENLVSTEINALLFNTHQDLFVNAGARNKKKGLFIKIENSIPQQVELPYSVASKQYFDQQNRVWFFQDYRISVNSFNTLHSRKTFKNYFLPKTLLVHQLFEYQGKHWIATNRGLFTFKEKISKTKPTLALSDSVTVTNGLPSNFINVVAKGKNGALWIGTKEGLSKLQNGVITTYTTQQGLVSDNCTSLLVDHQNHLWVGTSKGLSYFNGHRFVNYNYKTGLISPSINCLFLDQQHRLWIGTTKGLSVLDISRPPKTVVPPRLHIETIMVNGVPINASSEIVLNYDQGLTIRFQALSFIHPEGIRYQYRLNGGKWIETPLNFVNYNRFSFGKQLFEVRARKFNSDWSTIKKIAFDVTPPWWLSWWAIGLYNVLLLLSVYQLVRWRVRKLQKDKLRLEKLVAKRTYELEQQKEEIASQAEQLKEMDQVKSRFFSNISHEFKTPLTLIIGPAEKLLVAKQMKQIKTYSQYILANAHRLMKLINQLMDVSKIDSGKMPLQPTTGNLTAFLRQVLNSFELLAQQKNIQLELQTKQADIICDFDEDKIEKVFFNLLSNALKFTPDHGKVTLSLAQVDHQISMTVSDTGTGIPADQQAFIFDRFYQADDSGTRAYEGTGIGLALVKELVMLHEGTIEVSSQPTQGTTFTVKLPFTPKESDASIIDSVLPPLPQVPASEVENQVLSERMADTTKNTLLVVEDNPELREFIVAELSPSYNVLSAKDGAEGIDLALNNVPDLIVSDVMMPKVDGFELVKTLRQNQATSHIPIIILSAKSSFESKITGLEIGGDDYLTKPFSAKELLLRVRNMLDRRDRLREVLTQSISAPAVATQPKKRGASPKEEAFLEKVVEIVEQNLKNPTFDVAFFCQEIGMSHSSLFRKLKALTNMSIMEFVRTIKLKKAAELLQQTEYKVEDVAFQSGFNDISYFNKCFKKQFGVTPSEYQ